MTTSAGSWRTRGSPWTRGSGTPSSPGARPARRGSSGLPVFGSLSALVLPVPRDRGVRPEAHRRGGAARGLRPYDELLVDDLPTHEFANGRFPSSTLEAPGHLGARPPLDGSRAALVHGRRVRGGGASRPLARGQRGGHVLLWPARRSVSDVPLFMHPDEEYLIGFGICPRCRRRCGHGAAAPAGRERALDGHGGQALPLRLHHLLEGRVARPLRRSMEIVRGLKRRHDPEGRLNPGFIPFD